MPAGVAGFHGTEPLFGPVREGEHTLAKIQVCSLYRAGSHEQDGRWA